MLGRWFFAFCDSTWEESDAKTWASAANSPAEIIEHLKKAGEAWANGRAQEDDVTFVVVKIK